MDKKIWNQLVRDNAPAFGAFLQSWQWGEFQRAMGRQVERIFVESEAGKMLAQAIKMDLPLGHYYWYVPKGPLGSAAPEKMIEMLRNKLTGGMFYRIEPMVASRMLNVTDIQPSTTILIDLAKGQEAALSSN